MRPLLLIFLLLSACTPTPSPPTAPSQEIRFTPINIPGNLNRASFDCYLPPAVAAGEAIRAVLAVSAHETGPMYEDAAWRAVAERQRLLLVRFTVEAPQGATPATTGDGLRALTRAIQDHFSVTTRHPELRDAPYIFVGRGASGTQASAFADMLPDYTVASIALDAHTPRDMPRLAAGPGTRIPQLITVRPDHARADVRETIAFVRESRRLGGTVTLLIEPPAREIADAFALTWLEAVIRLRVPTRVVPGRGVLLAQADEDLYAGSFDLTPDARIDPASVQASPFREHRGNRGEAIWLPDGATARQWTKAMGRD